MNDHLYNYISSVKSDPVENVSESKTADLILLSLVMNGNVKYTTTHALWWGFER